MSKSLAPLAAGLVLGAAPVLAGSYVQSFTFADGTTALGGGATLINSNAAATGDGFPAGCVKGDALRLAERASGSRNVTFHVPSLDGATPLQSFTVTFALNFNRNAGQTPADGFSFSCGGGLTGATGETGFLAIGGMSVGWDTYANSAADPIAVDIFSDGAQVATVTAQSLFPTNPAPAYFPYDTTFRLVTIHWQAGMGLSVRYLNDPGNPNDDLIVVDNLDLPGFLPAGGETFAFSARTGGAMQDVFIDDLVISTTPVATQPNPETGGPVISEFLARNGGSPLEDEDRDTPDWIEIYNGSNTAVNLAGYSLSLETNGVPVAAWTFPSVNLPAYGYHLVFASGKNRTTFLNTYLHTNFTLPGSGGRLRLIRPGGSLASDQLYGNQTDAIPHGWIDYTQPAGCLETPTPGARNAGRLAAGPPLPDVVASTPSQVFTSPTNLVLQAGAGSPAGTQIRYTTNRGEPTEYSTLYTGPLAISAGTYVRARAFAPDRLPSAMVNRAFVYMDPAAAAASNLRSNYNGSGQPFRSTLPVLVLDSYLRNIDLVTNPAGVRPFRFSQAALYEVGATSGVADLGQPPTHMLRAATHVRGQSSAGAAQRPYALEFWKEKTDEDRDVSILGLPAESDFALHSPYFDKTLMRNFLAYQTLLETAGNKAAMRCRFVEVFFNQDNGVVDYNDYRGVYLLVERIKRTNDRLDLQKLNGAMAAPSLISGGFIFKIDKTPYQAPLTTAGSGTPWGARTWDVEEPEPVTTAQLNALKAYLDETDRALMRSDFANPASTNYYGRWLDADSYIHRHWWQELFKEVDGYTFSHYAYKDRGGVIHCLPLWDLDRSLGNSNYGNVDTAVGFHHWRTQAPHFQRLRQDPEHALREWDRWWRLRQGLFDATRMIQRIDNTALALTAGASPSSITNTSAPAVQNPAARHFRRWTLLGANTFGSANPGQFDRTTYGKEVDFIKSFLTTRLNWIDWISPQRAPDLLTLPGLTPVYQGALPVNTSLGLRNSTDASPIYYTLNGPDPRQTGGATDPAALVASGAGTTVATTWIAEGQSWKWLAPASDPGSAWKDPAFDDSAWNTNTTPLFYGESFPTGTNISPTPPAQTATDAPPPVYARKTFVVTNQAQYTGCLVDIRCDDGAVVYINGMEAFRVTMPLQVPVGHGTRHPTAAGGVHPLASGPQDITLYETGYMTLPVSPSLLVEGANLVAVSVHQAFYGNTTVPDMQFDCRVRGLVTTAPSAGVTLATPGAYTLRARAKNGANWGPLTEASFVVSAVPASAQNLAVSELHYHPRPPSAAELAAGYTNANDFEFIELLNFSTNNVDLTGVTLADAVQFSFSTADPDALFLPPGGRVLVVGHRNAFSARYPSVPLNRIAGAFTGNLSNGGETLDVLNAQGGLIQRVTYDDDAPWPEGADGAGHSLVFNRPGSGNPPLDAASWRPSAALGGNPGEADATPFPANPLGDDNGNGVPDLLEYALAPDYRVEAWVEAAPPPGGGVPITNLVTTIRRKLNADGFSLIPELSDDLTAWNPSAFAYERVDANGDGTATVRWRSLTPLTASRQHVRIRVQP